MKTPDPGDSGNHLQAFAQLSPEGRIQAIKYAWEGFYLFRYDILAAVPGVTGLIFGCLEISGGSDNDRTGQIAIGVVILVVTALISALLVILYLRKLRPLKWLQKAGKAYLEANYQSWLGAADPVLYQAAVTRLGVDGSAIRARRVVPGGNSGPPWPVVGKNHPPTFRKPKSVSAFVYLITDTFVAILPSSKGAVEEKRKGFLASVTGKAQLLVDAVLGDKMWVDLFATAFNFAGGHETVQITDPASLSYQELYFSEMVNAEFGGNVGRFVVGKFCFEGVSVVSISMRDGRTLHLPGDNDLVDLIRQQLRTAKVGQPAAQVAMTSNPAPGVPAGDTKTCPMCAETVKAAARVCRYCSHRFDAGEPPD